MLKLHHQLLAISCVLGTAVSAFAQGKAMDNIVVVLDASGSMKKAMPGTNQSRMEAAKQALLKIMQKVPRDTHVGLLVFSASHVSDEWVYPLGPLDAKKLEAAVRPLEAHGGTPLGVYMKKGSDRLMAQREKQNGYGTFRLLVLTDGEETDPKMLPTYLPDILSRGLTVDVIGVDMTSDHDLATRVHSYRRANDPASLTKAVSEVFAEVGGGRDNVANADAFASIQALPDEVAKSMLTALTPVGNHPIGEAPPAKVGEPSGGNVVQPPQTPMPQNPPNGQGGGTKAAFIAVAVVFGIIWVSRKRNRGRGGR